MSSPRDLVSARLPDNEKTEPSNFSPARLAISAQEGPNKDCAEARPGTPEVLKRWQRQPLHRLRGGFGAAKCLAVQWPLPGES